MCNKDRSFVRDNDLLYAMIADDVCILSDNVCGGYEYKVD
jgi:hypothetical protein